MIQFLNLALLAGLALASVPVIIHLMHRRKVRRVDWGAMRFLQETIFRTRRRLWIEEWLLLLVRVLILILLVLALLRPALKQNSTLLFQNDQVVRHGRTAAIIVFDDSASCAAGRTRLALVAMKNLAQAYASSLRPGDEFSLIRLSEVRGAPEDPMFDLELLGRKIEAITPTAVASDWLTCLEAALDRIPRHLNPNVEIVLVSDGMNQGWRETDRSRWEDLRRRFNPAQPAGSRGFPRIILLNPGAELIGHNLSLLSIKPEPPLLPAGTAVPFQVVVGNFGKKNSTATVAFKVRGQTITRANLLLEPGERQTLSFTNTFARPGSFLVEAEIEGRDDFPLDNSRCLAVQVEEGIPILLVEDSRSEGLNGSLGFLSTALQPDDQARDLFHVTRLPLAQAGSIPLSPFRAIILGDVATLDPTFTAHLERHVVTGGGLLVVTGPGTDRETANRFWARSLEGFLPAPLQQPTEPNPVASPSTANLNHPALHAFIRARDVWKQTAIRKYFQLEAAALRDPALDRLLTLQNGDPLIVERSRGAGRVLMTTTPLDARWSDLPSQAGYVPLVRGLVAYLSSFVQPARNLLAGERLVVVANAGNPPQTLRHGQEETVPLTSGLWEGRGAFLSPPLIRPGGYQVLMAGREPIDYSVAVAPEESVLAPFSPTEIKGLFTQPIHTLTSPETISRAFNHSTHESLEIWRWIIGALITLLAVESLLTRLAAGQPVPVPPMAPARMEEPA